MGAQIGCEPVFDLEIQRLAGWIVIGVFLEVALTVDPS